MEPRPPQSLRSSTGPHSLSYVQLPKDHRYYYQKDNYLNSSLFASSKVRQFYHEQREKMRPVREHLKAEEQKSQLQTRTDQAEKTQHMRKKSQLRLQRRKLQRSLVTCTQLESLSKQKSMPEDMNGISATTLFVDTLPKHFSLKKDKNMWNVLDEIPAERLKKLLPKKEMELDKEAAECLHSRLNTDLLSCSKSRLDTDDLRSQLVSRHQRVAQVTVTQLEAKSGIKKQRSPHRGSTPFGRANTYSSSNIIAKLSRPKEYTPPLDPFSRAEFRGMPYVDSLPAWRKIVTGVEAPNAQSLLNGSLTVSNKNREMRTKVNQSFSEEQMTEWMQELDTFSRYHKKPVAPSASQAELGEVMRGVHKPVVSRPVSNA